MIESESRFFINDRVKKNSIKQIIRKIYWMFQSIKYKVYLGMVHPIIIEKKYRVAICAIFKNEALYLREWIEFNHMVGVEHFYLYNNNSEDDYETVLKPYVEQGLVTLVQWPHNQKQMESYIDCIERFSSETKWLGFIDIDEFVVPKKMDNVYDFLHRFEKKAGAVIIYWKLFGTSGLMDRDADGFVTENFTVCWPKFCDIGKCFYNTAFAFDPNSKKSKQLHHKFWVNYKGRDIPPVNIFNHVCTGDRNIAYTDDFPIQINHYFTKSYKEYAMKRAKGDVYFEINPHDEEYFYKHEMKCMSTDYSAYKYLIKLKLAMNNKMEENNNCRQ